MEKNTKNLMLKKGRISYLDIARALTIFCVIIGHIVDSNTFTKNLLYAFHMPAFFFLSGLFFKKNIESVNEIKESIIRRFKRLMIPYIIWGCIYSNFSFKNLVYICYGTRETLICADSLTSLWFLPTLFVADILVEILIYVSSDLHKKIIEFVGAVIFFIVGFMVPHTRVGDPLGMDIAFIAASFMIIGHLLKGKMCKEQNSLRQMGIFLILGCGCLGVSIYFNQPSIGYVLMANAIYGNAIFFLLGALGGIAFLMGLSMIFDYVVEKKKVLIWIGQNTMGVFLIHKPFVELLRKISERFGFDYNYMPLTLFIAIVCLVLSCIVVQIVIRFIPTLFGKN